MIISGKNTPSKLSLPVIGLCLILTWGMRFLSLLFPDTVFWSINHLAFVDPGWRVVYIFAGLLGFIALFIPEYRAVKSIGGISGLLFDRVSFSRWIILSILFLPVFWFMRMPVNLLGDGLAMISDVGNDLPVIFKWTETGAIRLVYFVYQLLPQSGLEGARTAYAIVSVLSGAGTVFFFAGLAFEIGTESADRFLIFCLLLFAGWTLLFFGYAENYPVVWPFTGGFLYYGIKYIKSGRLVIMPFLFLAAATVIHLQAFFFLPALLVLIFSRGKGLRFFNKYRKQVIISALLIILAGVTIFIVRYCQSLEFRIHFLPVFTGRPATPGYAVFSLWHLLDIFNEFNLLLPLWPLLTAAAVGYWLAVAKEDKQANKTRWYLFVFSLGGLVFLFILDPKLGMSRDWDLFAICGLGPMLILLHGMARGRSLHKRYFPAVIIMALVAIIPFFAVNLSYQPSLKYYSRLLDHEYPRTESGMVGLIHYYHNTGNYSAADSLNNRVKEIYPRAATEKLVLDLAKSGNFDAAMRIADSMLAADPYSSKPYNIRGLVYFYKGEYEKAIPDLEQAARLVPESPPVLVNLATAYHRLKQVDKMMPILRQAQKIDPENLEMINTLAAGFYALGRYDSAMVYAGEMIRRDSTNEDGYLISGVGAYMTGDFQKAKVLINHFLELDPDAAEKPDLLRILNHIEQLGQ